MNFIRKIEIIISERYQRAFYFVKGDMIYNSQVATILEDRKGIQSVCEK